jgi:hypothetical protein
MMNTKQFSTIIFIKSSTFVVFFVSYSIRFKDELDFATKVTEDSKCTFPRLKISWQCPLQGNSTRLLTTRLRGQVVFSKNIDAHYAKQCEVVFRWPRNFSKIFISYFAKKNFISRNFLSQKLRNFAKFLWRNKIFDRARYIFEFPFILRPPKRKLLCQKSVRIRIHPPPPFRVSSIRIRIHNVIKSG